MLEFLANFTEAAASGVVAVLALIALVLAIYVLVYLTFLVIKKLARESRGVKNVWKGVQHERRNKSRK